MGSIFLDYSKKTAERGSLISPCVIIGTQGTHIHEQKLAAWPVAVIYLVGKNLEHTERFKGQFLMIYCGGTNHSLPPGSQRTCVSAAFSPLPSY